MLVRYHPWEMTGIADPPPDPAEVGYRKAERYMDLTAGVILMHGSTMKLLCILIILILLCVPPAQAQQKFLMGYSSFSSNQIPLWVAKDEGLFKSYGTDPI